MDAGVLISYRLILTTAKIMKFNPKKVLVGSNKLNDGAYYEIGQLIPHPGYNENNLDNNVGLIKTVSKIEKSDYVEKIELQPDPIAGDIPLEGMGWGWTHEDNNLQNDLKYARFTSISPAQCQNQVNGKELQRYYNEKVICFEGFDHGQQAFGAFDLGGPLVLDNALVGIVFLPCSGDDCKPKPQMAYRVHEYAQWILSHMQ